MTFNRCPSTPALFLLYHLLFFLLPHCTQAGHRQIQYKITGKATECIYEHLAHNDVATFSVFVIEALQNGKPRAAVTFDGPVANITMKIPQTLEDYNKNHYNNKNNEPELEPAGKRKGKQNVGRSIRQSLLNEWPKISGPHAPNGVKERIFQVDWTHAGESEDAIMARAAILEKTHEDFRNHKLASDKLTGEKTLPLPLHTIAQTSIHPYEETVEIELNGWYRLCVRSSFSPLLVEMDIRIANRLRGINPDTGHVYTYEVREYEDESILLFGKEQEEKKFIRDDDFTKSNKILKYMHELTSKIMKSQHERSHRIRAHDADARRGAAELAWSSKFETFLYVVIIRN